MRTIAAIGLCIALAVTYTRFALAEDQPQAEASATTQDATTTGDEVHFVSVLTMNGEVVAVDPASLLVTLKSASGGSSTLQVRSEKDIEAVKPGDHVVVRYFEGAEVGNGKVGTAAPSLKDGIVGAQLGGLSTKHPLVVSVERVDAVNQEITIKGSDGSLETIEVTNPAHLKQIKVGDKIVITHNRGAGPVDRKTGLTDAIRVVRQEVAGKETFFMYFTNDSMLPENQQPLIITVAPYGPQWLPSDYPEDTPVTWEQQTQKAVDCYNWVQRSCISMSATQRPVTAPRISMSSTNRSSGYVRPCRR